MRDYYLTIGAVAGNSVESENMIDFDKATLTGNLNNINVVFKTTTGGSQAVTVLESDDGENFTAALVGPTKTVVDNENYVLPMPKEHKRYIKVSALLAGEAWIQPAV